MQNSTKESYSIVVQIALHITINEKIVISIKKGAYESMNSYSYIYIYLIC